MLPDDIPTEITKLVYTFDAPRLTNLHDLSQNETAQILAHFWPAIAAHIRAQPVGKPGYRLARIAEAHSKNITAGGMTSGDCDECGYHWPCPTYAWATTDRDVLAAWDPMDDEDE